MPSQLIIIFITTKNGKSEGKIALKNSFAPDIAYWIQIFGASIIWIIIKEQIIVINIFIFNVLNNLNNNIIMKINNITNSITNSKFNAKPLFKVLLY